MPAYSQVHNEKPQEGGWGGSRSSDGESGGARRYIKELKRARA